MADLAKVGDPVTCPKCGPTTIATGSPDTFLDGQPVAIAGVSQTACGAILISGLAWLKVNDCPAAVFGSMTSHGGRVLATSTAKTGAPSSISPAFRNTTLRNPELNTLRYQHVTYGYRADPAQPEHPGGMMFVSEPDGPCVFAKSCSVPPGSVEAAKVVEPATSFGSAIALGTVARTSGAAAAGTPFGVVAGGEAGALASLGQWSLRLASAAAGTVFSGLLLALAPRQLGDGTLYTDDELKRLSEAATRVRFQFRRDAQGIVHAYGLHTSATSGLDSVRVVQARWSGDRSYLEAHVGGVTITWTPNQGPILTQPTVYPGVTETLSTILVHPIPEETDSQITVLPGTEDLTWQDCILVFPADSGAPPLYVVFAKPALSPLEVGTYSDFAGRPRNGLHADHIPSKKAIEIALSAKAIFIRKIDISIIIDQTATLAIPARVHQKLSETYGFRNTLNKQIEDSKNLYDAVERNINAIRSGLLEEGYTNHQIDEAKIKIHEINKNLGLYQ